MADAAEESQVTMYLFCLECNDFRDFTISRNVSSYAFKEAVRKVEPLYGSVWLVCLFSACLSTIEFTSIRQVPPGEVSIDDLETPSVARSALREHFKTCNKGLKRLKHRNHEEWLQTVQDGGLHLVVRHGEYSL